MQMPLSVLDPAFSHKSCSMRCDYSLARSEIEFVNAGSESAFAVQALLVNNLVLSSCQAAEHSSYCNSSPASDELSPRQKHQHSQFHWAASAEQNTNYFSRSHVLTGPTIKLSNLAPHTRHEGKKVISNAWFRGFIRMPLVKIAAPTLLQPSLLLRKPCLTPQSSFAESKNRLNNTFHATLLPSPRRSPLNFSPLAGQLPRQLRLQ